MRGVGLGRFLMVHHCCAWQILTPEGAGVMLQGEAWIALPSLWVARSKKRKRQRRTNTVGAPRKGRLPAIQGMNRIPEAQRMRRRRRWLT